MFQESIGLAELHELRIALADKEAQLGAVLEAARMASWGRDRGTGRTTTSELMADLWGLLPGQTFEGNAQDYQLLHPDDVMQQRTLVNDVRVRGGSWHTEFRAIRPRDGKVVWLEERGTARIDLRSGHLRVDGVICAITQPKL